MTDDISASPLTGDERNAALRNANACAQMADLCGELLDVAPELTPRELLRALGALVAGIDLGVIGFKQLARGGSNGLVGAGFRAEYDDGTAGQARHFAGTAAAAALVGEKPAELLAHHLVDSAESIDGHLSTAALEFAHALIDGDLPLDRAGEWIRTRVCDPNFVTGSGPSPFDVFSEPSAKTESPRVRFSDAEWRALAELPELVAVAAALSEPTGGIDDVRDLIAGLRGIEAAAESQSVLVRAVVAERYDEGFVWGHGDGQPGERIGQVLSRVRDGLAAVRAAGFDAAEMAAYASLLLTVANMSVRGSRTGGVLGIGGRTVSPHEASFLDQLENVLEASLSDCDDCLR